MNIRTKLTIVISALVGMIVLLVALSAVNLQILTATEPDSPAAAPGLQRALAWVYVVGGICVACGLVLIFKFPSSVSKPIEEVVNGIQEIANHNYSVRLDINDNPDMQKVSRNFNRMAKRLEDYHQSSISRLKISNNFREAIINGISEPIIGLKADMSIAFINDSALDILNLKREDVLDRSASEIALRNDLLRRLVRELIGEKSDDNRIDSDKVRNDSRSSKKEPLKIYANNKESYFQTQYIEIKKNAHDLSGQVTDGYLIMLKNITEFKELDSAKTTFISTISHELKTPISAILMSQKLLEDKRIGTLSPEQEELSTSIRENSERLLSITSELLNMTQVESGKLQLKPKITKPIELINYAIKANQVQADKFNIHIEVEYPDEPAKIGNLFVDSEKIAWVLTNILSNAIRYSPENSRVIIGACRTDDGQIRMYVQDFGKGIDPRYHSSIFDHYFRVPGTKVQGSGLGLSISKDFVEAHNGTITVESEVGKGSRFIISFKA